MSRATSRLADQRVGQVRSQAKLDFNRAAKLGMLDRIVIPADTLSVHQDRIGSMRGLLLKIKALLRAIESFAGNDSECFASVKTIGKRIGCSERTTQRYLNVAKLIGLVTVIPGRHHTTSIHDINWIRVWEWSQPAADINEGRQQSREGRQERPSGVTTTAVRDDNAVTQIAMTRPEAQIETPSNGDGFLKCSATERKDKQPEGSSPNYGGWPEPITVATLSDRKQVDELFEFALGRAWVHQDDRHRFRTLAKYCARAAKQGCVKDAGATFTADVKAKCWYGSNADEQAAINAAPRVSASPGGDLLDAHSPIDKESAIARLDAWSQRRTATSIAQSAQPPPTDLTYPQTRTDAPQQ